MYLMVFVRMQRFGSRRVYAALWIGAWLVASGAAVDAFPDDLDQLAAQFFLRCRPAAKA